MPVSLLPVQPDQRPDEDTQPLVLGCLPCDVLRRPHPGVHHHAFEFSEVRCRQRLVEPESGNRNVILVRLEDGTLAMALLGASQCNIFLGNWREAEIWLSRASSQARAGNVDILATGMEIAVARGAWREVASRARQLLTLKKDHFLANKTLEEAMAHRTTDGS